MPLGFNVSFKIDTRNYNKNNKKILRANFLVIKKLIIAIAGPLTNLLLILFFIILGKEKIVNIKTETLIYTNILIFIFNMLPIYPLDGGRILKNVLHLSFGKIKSLKITIFTSNVFAVLLTIFGLIILFTSNNILYLLILIYIWILIINENRIFKMKIKMYKILENYLAIIQD